jgi:hypothetical protein
MDQAREIMRVSRDETGGIVVEVQGRTYKHIREITDGQVGRLVLQAIADLVKFTGGLIAVATTEQRLPTKAVPPAAAAPEAPRESPVSAPPERPEEEFLRQVAAGKVGAKEEGPIRRGLFGLRRPKPVLPPLPTNFVAEINAIFQRRLLEAGLAGEPENLVTADIKGGLRIKVSGGFYSSPDEVADPVIRDLLKASVKEWEER